MLARFGNRRLPREFCRVGHPICWDAVHLGRAWFGGDESRASPRASRTLSRTGADIGAGAGPYRDNAETAAGQVPGGRGSGAGRQRVHIQRVEISPARAGPSRSRRHANRTGLVETGSRGAGAGIGHAALASCLTSTRRSASETSAIGSSFTRNSRHMRMAAPRVSGLVPARTRQRWYRLSPVFSWTATSDTFRALVNSSYVIAPACCQIGNLWSIAVLPQRALC